MDFTKSEAKAWAREAYVGLESLICPSFTPDLANLDEEGIRHDVQHAISQGFFSILCNTDSTAMTLEERKRFVAIVNHEAKDKILVSFPFMTDTFEQELELLKHHEKTGGTHILLGYPVQYYPDSEEDIYQAFKTVCDSTNVAVDLYPASKFNFERFHPSTFNPALLDRMADLPNAVAMKIGVLDPGYMAECFRLVGDKILVNSPAEGNWPTAVPKYGQQWAGGLMYDAYQTPDNPLLVTHFDLLRAGELDEAMEIYWRVTAIRTVVWQQFMLYSVAACYPFTLWKYYKWLAGGNGGMLRQPIHRLFEHDKDAIKGAMRAAGLTLRDAPEEEFYVGRVNYAKGARLKARVEG